MTVNSITRPYEKFVPFGTT